MKKSKVSKVKKSAKAKAAPKKVKAPVEADSSSPSSSEEIIVKRKTPFDLVVVESPSKAKTLKKYLGSKYEVLASKGHIKDLPKSKLGVDVKKNFNWELQYIPGKKSTMDKIHEYAQVADHVYLGPDPDREGEAIAFHLAEEIGKKKNVFRVLFNAVTKQKVLEAIQNPTKLDQNKYDSQKARRILDRLVGYKISPLLWDKVQRGLSAGRVQSVALRLIVNREAEIKKFVPEQWFSIHANLKKEDITFEATYFGKSMQKKEELNLLKDAEAIVKKVKDRPFVVEEVKKKERRYNPTPPFTTSKLQQEAANKLGFSAQKTMMVAQKLYEGIELEQFGASGLITYMRTDSVRTEPSAIEDLRKYIKHEYGADYVADNPIFYQKKSNSAKVQDAHEAIRPANLDFHPRKVQKDLSEDEYKLYSLIWNKYVSSQMSSAVVDQTSVFFNCENLFFKSVGSITKFPGFRSVYLESLFEKMATKKSNSSDEEEVEEHKNQGKELPELKIHESLKPLKVPQHEEHWTSPPPRYGDASIVKELEENGIGRPSTYANIITNIVDKGYVQKLENRYNPTDLGIIVCEMLVNSFPQVMDVNFTAQVEQQLDKIEEGELVWTKVLQSFYRPFEETLEKAKEEMKNLKKTSIPTGISCRKCQSGEYTIKWGKNGQFLACSNYPDCTSTEDFTKNAEGVITIIEKVYSGDPCPTCGKRMVHKKGRYGRFLACEDYPVCKTALPFTIDVKCPKCAIGKFAEKKSRYNKIFYGCTQYPDCNYALWDLPVNQECPSCHHPILCQKISKKLGKFLSCPSCRHKVLE